MKKLFVCTLLCFLLLQGFSQVPGYRGRTLMLKFGASWGLAGFSPIWMAGVEKAISKRTCIDLNFLAMNYWNGGIVPNWKGEHIKGINPGILFFPFRSRGQIAPLGFYSKFEWHIFFTRYKFYERHMVSNGWNTYEVATFVKYKTALDFAPFIWTIGWRRILFHRIVLNTGVVMSIPTFGIMRAALSADWSKNEDKLSAYDRSGNYLDVGATVGIGVLIF